MYSGGTDRPCEFCYNFSVSNDLTQMINFPTRSLSLILTVLLFWIYLFLLMLVFVLQWLSHRWEILIMLLTQFPLTFPQIHKGMPHFIAYLMAILVLIRMVSVIIWEMFCKRIFSNFAFLLPLVNFVTGFRLELMYISFFASKIRSSLTCFHDFHLLLLLP